MILNIMDANYYTQNRNLKMLDAITYHRSTGGTQYSPSFM